MGYKVVRLYDAREVVADDQPDSRGKFMCEVVVLTEADLRALISMLQPGIKVESHEPAPS